MEKIKLFCLPHAGGTSSAYNKWKKDLHPQIELHPVELSARGRRFNSPLYSEFSEAVTDVYNLIKDDLYNSKFAFWGHSMGSLIVYELIHLLNEYNLPEPVHSFFSGRYAPEIKKEKHLSLLTDKDLIAELSKLGGISAEFLENSELLDLFLPIIRADYSILEKYKYHSREYKFNFNISVFGGKMDIDVPIDSLSTWSLYTKKKCNIYTFDGGHFFFDENHKEITKIINNTLINI